MFIFLFTAHPTLLFTTGKDVRVANVSRPAKVTTIVKVMRKIIIKIVKHKFEKEQNPNMIQ